MCLAVDREVGRKRSACANVAHTSRQVLWAPRALGTPPSTAQALRSGGASLPCVTEAHLTMPNLLVHCLDARLCPAQLQSTPSRSPCPAGSSRFSELSGLSRFLPFSSSTQDLMARARDAGTLQP